MGIITTENLIHEYIRRDENGDRIGEKRAVDDVCLDVERGQFISILGHNGSGKSTLAKHINALLLPTDGRVVVLGMDTKDEDRLFDIRKAAGMVFQNPDNQIIATVVEDDVAFGPENLGVPPKEIEKRVEECLKAVGMYERKDDSPNRLSGGQKQRIAVAGIMAMKPDCIILDEPTAMLDPDGRKEVLATVRRLNQEEHITVLLITHYMNEVTFSDRVIVMDHGKIAMQGTPREIFRRVSELTALGLDAPQATVLAYRLRQKGFPLPEDILMEEEFIKAYHVLPEEYRVSNPYDTLPKKVQESVTLLSEHEAPLIELKDVTYRYGTGTVYEKVALKNVSMQIRKGEFVCLIGRTGSGKSTLIRMLNGLEKPSEGQVLYKGEDINAASYNRKELRSHVGLVFQYPEDQLFEATVLKDVCFGPKNQGLSGEEQLARAREALELVQVDEDIWNDSPLSLSGGQKRRVAIAGVMAMHPEVLILDEPTAGLDPHGRDEILSAIAQIRERAGITVVLVSHSMEDVANFANWIHVMDRGSLLYAGKPEVVFTHTEELKKVGLDVPQITKIMRGIFHPEEKPSMDFITIEAAEKALLSGKE